MNALPANVSGTDLLSLMVEEAAAGSNVEWTAAQAVVRRHDGSTAVYRKVDGTDQYRREGS